MPPSAPGEDSSDHRASFAWRANLLLAAKSKAGGDRAGILSGTLGGIALIGNATLAPKQSLLVSYGLALVNLAGAFPGTMDRMARNDVATEFLDRRLNGCLSPDFLASVTARARLGGVAASKLAQLR